MSADDHDTRFMREALHRAKLAYPLCLPSPPVGCVLVKNNQIIASGFTREPGKFHAEADALSRLTGPLDEVDAYVTLEPCSCFGRTPSCALGLVERKIRAVSVSLLDPHSRNRGKGIQILESAGIRVHVGILKEEVFAFCKDYLITE